MSEHHTSPRTKGLCESDLDLHDATYAPDADQISVYPSCRLAKETWATMKAAGWKWCPKQERFKSKWTPSAEDVALDLAGEIEEEALSIADRAVERADRFGGYEDNRIRDANQAHAQAHDISERFTGGQPILVGHHSERRARRDRDRMHRAMASADLNWSKADYWQRRAAGVIRHALQKDSVGTRRNRIKVLEADIRRYEQRAESWPDCSYTKRFLSHFRMRLDYERAILTAQLEELGQADRTYAVGGRIGGALILTVNRSRGSDEPNSLTVIGSEEPTGSKYHDTQTVKASRFHQYRYEAPSEASLAELKAWKAKRAAATPKAPPLTNCRETCELLAEIWNHDNQKRGLTRGKVSVVVDMSQKAYSARSKGTYSICNAVVVNQFGTEYYRVLGGCSTDHQQLFRVRQFGMSGLSDRGDCPVFLTDKPSKPNPHLPLLRELVAAIRAESAVPGDEEAVA